MTSLHNVFNFVYNLVTFSLCGLSPKFEMWNSVLWLSLYFQIPSKSNGSHQDGATQRAAALAALSSAFNPSAEKKPVLVRTPTKTQGSQRSAAWAALSSALTAEKKSGTPDGSPLQASQSPPLPQSSLDGALWFFSHLAKDINNVFNFLKHIHIVICLSDGMPIFLLLHCCALCGHFVFA